jgi:hypothetical protein
MAITLLGHQPIDFTYKENAPCERISNYCVQYETADNPQFQIKGDGSSGVLVTIQGAGETDFDEISLPASMVDVNGDYFTYTLNFEELGITEGCYILCVYEPTGDDLVLNGNFTSDLSEWSVVDGIALTIDSYTNPTTAEADDGEVVLLVSGGTPTYTYSIDGITYGASDTFSNLSYGVEYVFYVKDSNGVIGSIEYQFIDCSAYAGSGAYDLIDIFAFDIKDCEANNFV